MSITNIKTEKIWKT